MSLPRSVGCTSYTSLQFAGRLTLETRGEVGPGHGAPRAAKQALLAVPIGDRETDALRLVFQGPGPRLTIAEAFLYGPAEGERAAFGAPDRPAPRGPSNQEAGGAAPFRCRSRNSRTAV